MSLRVTLKIPKASLKGPDRTFRNGVNIKITPSLLLYRWHSNQFILSYLINTLLLIYFESLFLINYTDENLTIGLSKFIAE